MRTIGSPAELERRRHLAVERVREGYTVEEVADFLGIDPSSVRRWMAASQIQGVAGLMARSVLGRPPKLTITQEKIALRWLADNPTDHGFATELWTAPRLGSLIEQEFVHLGAEPAHVYVHDVAVAVEVHVPDLLGDQGPRQHLPRPPGQQRQQGELLGRQLQAAAAPGRLEADPVNFQVGEAQDLRAPGRAAAQQRADPGQELGERE